MLLCKVVGTVVTTISHPHYDHRRLLVVQPLIGEDENPDGEFVAVDHTHAGIGDTVLARDILHLPDGCIISVIVGIVDMVEICEE